MSADRPYSDKHRATPIGIEALFLQTEGHDYPVRQTGTLPSGKGVKATVLRS